MHYDFVALSVFFLIVGALWLRDAAIRMKRGLESNTWIATRGFSEGGTITLADTPIVPQRGSGPTYSVFTSFVYRVDGAEYRGTTLSYRRVFPYLTGYAAKRDLDKKYPSGMRVIVYYDPTDPSRSVMEPGVGFQNYLAVAMAAVLFMMGVLLATTVFG